MKNPLLILVTTLSVALAASQRVSYDGYKVYRVDVGGDRGEATHIVSSLSDLLNLDVWKSSKDHFDVMAGPSTQREVERVLSENRLNYRVMVENVQSLIDETATTKTTTSKERYSGRPHSMDWDAYHSLQEIYEYIDYIAGNVKYVMLLCYTCTSMGKLGWVKAFVTDLGEWLNVDLKAHLFSNFCYKLYM